MKNYTTFTLRLFSLIMIAFPALAFQKLWAAPTPATKPGDETKIQVALLIDTSGSMDGLIEQAKSQLWLIVNELAKAKFDGKAPVVEIALYEYGNDRLPYEEGYLKQIMPLSGDLDKLSEELFKLTTYGGSEYCGMTIQHAVDQLQWTNNQKDLKLIYIAGNEIFEQGPVPYKDACKSSLNKGIYINTIYCGDFQTGITEFWKDAADRSGGRYTNIDVDHTTTYIATPYDDTLSFWNDSLNTTYIAYGYEGEQKLENQVRQDNNAKTYGAGNMAERVTAKSSSVYNNYAWDLVDAEREKAVVIDELKEEELPIILKGKSKEEIKAYIQEQAGRRTEFNSRINEINKKRETYITDQRKNMSEENSLDQKIIGTLREQAEKLNYVFE